MVSKYELIGIFLSIGTMALILAFFRFNLGDVALFSGNEPAAAVVAVDTTEDRNTAFAEAFKEGATNSGKLQKLIIDDVRIGTEGDEVKKGDVVTVHYEGRTQDGTRFDSSYERGEAFTFKVGEGKVIDGWEAGLIGMKVGGQRVLVVPPDMAYGNAQVGPIAPNSILVFSIELLEIN